MQRLTLPLIAAALLLLAVGGVFFGLRVQPETTPVRQTASHTEPGSGEAGQPEAPPATPPSDPASFIRFGVPTPPAKPAGAIRLATYNAENLFDAIDDPTLSGRNEDIDDAKPEPQLQSLADTIRTLDADILALEEIESEAVITWFRDTYLADLGYTHIASIDAGDERGIEQAVLCRYPVTGIKNWPRRELGGTHPDKWGDAENYNAGEPIRFHRSPLRVEVEIPSETTGGPPYHLALYVVHAKSGGPGEYWRQAEATGLVTLLNGALAADPHENIAILGDFNALLNAGSVQTILDAGFDDALGDVFEPGPRFATHESGRRIDHILVNRNLAAEALPASGFVLGTPALPEGMDWRDEWRPEGFASDHYPVALDIIPRESASPE